MTDRDIMTDRNMVIIMTDRDMVITMIDRDMGGGGRRVQEIY